MFSRPLQVARSSWRFVNDEWDCQLAARFCRTLPAQLRAVNSPPLALVVNIGIVIARRGEFYRSCARLAVSYRCTHSSKPTGKHRTTKDTNHTKAGKVSGYLSCHFVYFVVTRSGSNTCSAASQHRGCFPRRGGAQLVSGPRSAKALDQSPLCITCIIMHRNF